MPDENLAAKLSFAFWEKFGMQISKQSCFLGKVYGIHLGRAKRVADKHAVAIHLRSKVDKEEHDGGENEDNDKIRRGR